MLIKRFKPAAPLQPYISRIWVFENQTGIPSDDAKLIAPNGCMKLIVPYKKRVTSFIGQTKMDHPPISILEMKSVNMGSTSGYKSGPNYRVCSPA